MITTNAILKIRRDGGEPLTWTRSSVIPVLDFFAVGYGNGYYVAAGGTVPGGAPALCTANDPTGTWTQRSLPVLTGQINSVHYANGYWVAVTNHGAILTATDPTGTWTVNGSNPFGLFQPIYDVSYANGYWVVAAASDSSGQPSLIAYATDPTGTWTAAYSTYTYNFRALVYASGLWTVVGQVRGGGGAGIVVTSTDPTTGWTLSVHTYTVALHDVYYGNNYWVSTQDHEESTKQRIYTTDPTILWTVTAPTTFDSCVFYGANSWVIGVYGITAWVATDPTGTWVSVSLDFQVGLDQSGGCTDVTYGDGYWVAVGRTDLTNGYISWAQPGV